MTQIGRGFRTSSRTRGFHTQLFWIGTARREKLPAGDPTSFPVLHQMQILYLSATEKKQVADSDLFNARIPPSQSQIMNYATSVLHFFYLYFQCKSDETTRSVDVAHKTKGLKANVDFADEFLWVVASRDVIKRNSKSVI